MVYKIQWKFAKQIMEICKASMELTLASMEMVCAPVKCSILNTVFGIWSEFGQFFTHLLISIFVLKIRPRNKEDFRFENRLCFTKKLYINFILIHYIHLL